VRARIAAAAVRAGRDPGEIALVGVSKRHPPEAVAAAAREGLTRFGENFVQEARDKIPKVQAILEDHGAALSWHFVGRLQRNKARLAAELFAWVESLDRVPLADALDRGAAGSGRELTALIQVNLSREPQKGGAAPEELPALLEHCRGLAHLRVRGLMTVPALGEDPETTRPTFARLRELRDSQEEPKTLPELSMGMTADFEVAIEEGATLVRVGTALFGPRET
jgi:pyridoxal phosphate enzyme (YggS family)